MVMNIKFVFFFLHVLKIKYNKMKQNPSHWRREGTGIIEIQ